MRFDQISREEADNLPIPVQNGVHDHIDIGGPRDLLYLLAHIAFEAQMFSAAQAVVRLDRFKRGGARHKALGASAVACAASWVGGPDQYFQVCRHDRLADSDRDAALRDA